MRVGIVEIAIAVGVHVEVANVGVVDVHVVPVATAAVIPGMEGFAPTEREPAEAAAPAKSEAKTNTKTGAKPANEGRAVVRIGVDRTRGPTPVAAKIVPAAIVKGSKAPRSIIDPGPAPRANVGPVAIAVRSPVWRDVVRNPNVAVGGFFFPGAVVVGVAVADCVRIDVLGESRIVFLQIAVLGPTIKIVRFMGGARGHFDVALSASHVDAFTGLDGINLTAGGNFARTADRGDSGEVTIFADVNAEGAGFADSEREVGGINFIVLALANFADAKIEFALGDTNLGDVLVEIEERD